LKNINNTVRSWIIIIIGAKVINFYRFSRPFLNYRECPCDPREREEERGRRRRKKELQVITTIIIIIMMMMIKVAISIAFLVHF